MDRREIAVRGNHSRAKKNTLQGGYKLLSGCVFFSQRSSLTPAFMISQCLCALRTATTSYRPVVSNLFSLKRRWVRQVYIPTYAQLLNCLVWENAMSWMSDLVEKYWFHIGNQRSDVILTVQLLTLPTWNCCWPILSCEDTTCGSSARIPRTSGWGTNELHKAHFSFSYLYLA